MKRKLLHSIHMNPANEDMWRYLALSLLTPVLQSDRFSTSSDDNTEFNDKEDKQILKFASDILNMLGSQTKIQIY